MAQSTFGIGLFLFTYTIFEPFYQYVFYRCLEFLLKGAADTTACPFYLYCFSIPINKLKTKNALLHILFSPYYVKIS